MSAKKKQKKSFVKIVKWIAVAVSAIILYLAYIFFAPNINPPTDEKSYLCIPDSSTFADVTRLLEKNTNVFNVSSFKQVSELLQYGAKIRSGRYEIKKGMNNFQLVRILRSGRQTPVRLKFNNIRTKKQLAARLSSQVMADSVSILNLLDNETFLAEYHLNPATSISIFIPNTYEVFWNMNAKQLFEKMNKEYLKF